MCIGKEREKEENAERENQTKPCATTEFMDTISCVLDENLICSFRFPSACSSIVKGRSVELTVILHTQPKDFW